MESSHLCDILSPRFLYDDESKSGLASDLDDRLQSQNVPLALLVIYIEINL